MPLPIITTLADRAVEDMLRRAQHRSVVRRQLDAAMRVDVLEGDWRIHGIASMGKLYRNPAIRNRVAEFWNPSPNIAKQLLALICVAYEHPPIRHLRGASEARQTAFAKLVKETGVHVDAQSWERLSRGLNTIIVVPVVRKREGGRVLVFELLLPHHTHVVTADDDPYGPPVATISTFGSSTEYDTRAQSTVVIDEEAWRYYRDGRLERTVPHGAGVYPGVVFRLRKPIDDYWNSGDGAGVFAATLSAAHLQARMDWVRFGQDRLKELLISKRLGNIPNQVVGAEGPTDVPVEPAEIKYQVEDLNTPIDRHLDHIIYHARGGARDWDVPPDMIDFQVGSEGLEPTVAAHQHATLATLRDHTIAWYTDAETQLWWKTALVLQGMGHTLARELRPSEVLDRFEAKFPALSFVEHPEVKTRVLGAQVDLGVMSTFRAYQELHPGLTLEQAKVEVIAMAHEEAELEQIYITHNLPRRGRDRRQTIAEVQGALGGMRSGEERAAKQDERNPGRADAQRRPGGGSAPDTSTGS